MKDSVDKSLTPQEQLFVQAYLNNGRKQTQATITAGYSKKAAKVQANKLMKLKRIQAAIAANDKKVVKRIKGSADWKKKRLLQVMEFLIKVENGKVIELVNAKAFLSAMAEHNKMEGHYSAEKVENHNYNADTDIETLRKERIIQEEILAKHRKKF